MSKTGGKHPIGIKESDAHGGHGRGQGGAGNWGGGVAESNQKNPVIGHKTSGKGKGYNTEAHTMTHHGNDGEAAGHKDDLKPNSYTGKLHGEGMSIPHNGDGAGSPRAEHHTAPSREPHKFSRPPTKEAHGFGYSQSNKKGHLRMSGHSKGHRIGCK